MEDLQESREQIVLTCDHDEGTTHRNGKLLTIGFKTDDCTLSAFGNYPLQCVIKVGDEEYTLDQHWGESFVIYRHAVKGQLPVQHEPVDTLVLPHDHNVLRLLMEIEDDRQPVQQTQA